jgi:hypothetical protein
MAKKNQSTYRQEHGQLVIVAPQGYSRSRCEYRVHGKAFRTLADAKHWVRTSRDAAVPPAAGYSWAKGRKSALGITQHCFKTVVQRKVAECVRKSGKVTCRAVGRDRTPAKRRKRSR